MATMALPPTLLKEWVGREGCRKFQFESQDLAGLVAVLLTAFIALGGERPLRAGAAV